MNDGIGKYVSERAIMNQKSIMVSICMLFLAGGTGYLLFGRIGFLAGPVIAGIFYGVHFLTQSLRASDVMWHPIGARFRLSADVLDWVWDRQQRRDAQALEREAHLESLKVKAHHLASACHDIYGAQRYCLEIIGQTEKDDPLFTEACDLYMRTITDQPRRRRDLTSPGLLIPRHNASRPVSAGADVIPFPRSASRN
jgi:hypothetical protein